MPQPPGRRRTIEECRHLLGSAGAGFSDGAIERLRDQLYAMAEFVIREHDRSVRETRQLNALSLDDRVSVEERAAIFEFDGKMPAGAALTRALALRPERRARQRQPH